MRKVSNTLCVILLLGLCFAAIPAPSEALFRSRETVSDDLKSFTKWISVLNREPKARQKRCTNGACSATNWLGHLKLIDIRKQTPKSLRMVNDYFNQTPYLQDIHNWGKNDYWAIPLQFLVRFGDCEDYAIAKYMALRQQGWPVDSMRVVVVQDMNLGVLHSVLAVTLEDETYILDNQITQLLTDDQIYHYTPIYSINERQWWRHYLG